MRAPSPARLVVCVALTACGGGSATSLTDGGRADAPAPTDGPAADRHSPDGAPPADAAGADAAADTGSQGCLTDPPHPDLPAGDFDLGGTCEALTPCGGQLEGTGWFLTSLCTSSNVEQKIRSVCSTAVIGNWSNGGARGSIYFSGGRMNLSASGSASTHVTLPNSCTGCRCADMESRLISAGVVGARCSPVCNGGQCDCTIDVDVEVRESSSYSVEGNTVVTQAGRRYDFCAMGDDLRLKGPGLAAARFQPAAASPEICDGLDNDLDGVVDDNPVECASACNTEGVCAQGATPRCAGGRWACQYTSPMYQANETTCDRLDNDCDGMVDEHPGCRELCDGMDNDADGVIDNNLADQPTNCASRGVCAAGPGAVCGGAAGWHCEYPTEYQASETTCDGKDNDCDGMTDEPVECREVCDGKDNDADGVVDDNLTDTPPPCWPLGVCAPGGPPTCAGGAGWTCAASAVTDYERVESKCDGLDNDCDGVADETCSPCASVQRVCTIAWDSAASTNTLRCANPDGSSPSTQIAGLPLQVGDFFIDEPNSKLYFQASSIKRSALDGSNVETLKGALWQGAPIAVDPSRQFLYWGDGSSSLWRMTIATKAEAPLITAFPTAGALEITGGQLYYGTISGPRAITRANLDGTGKQTILPDNLGDGFTVDLIGNRIFYDNLGGELHVMDLDARNDRKIPVPIGQVRANVIAVDPWAGFVYYTRQNGNDPANNGVLRVRLDGSMYQQIFPQGSQGVQLTGCRP